MGIGDLGDGSNPRGLGAEPRWGILGWSHQNLYTKPAAGKRIFQAHLLNSITYPYILSKSLLVSAKVWSHGGQRMVWGSEVPSGFRGVARKLPYEGSVLCGISTADKRIPPQPGGTPSKLLISCKSKDLRSRSMVSIPILAHLWLCYCAFANKIFSSIIALLFCQTTDTVVYAN